MTLRNEFDRLFVGLHEVRRSSQLCLCHKFTNFVFYIFLKQNEVMALPFSGRPFTIINKSEMTV